MHSQDALDQMRDEELERLRAENQRLREALEKIAGMPDFGLVDCENMKDIAQQALEGK